MRSVLDSRLTGKTSFTTSTTPKTKPQAANAGDYAVQQYPAATGAGARMKLAFIPVYVAIGMITLQVGFGLFTVFHQLRRAPNVCVKKSRRESVAEVTEPEHVAEEGDKFLKESFFRKIAHIQDIDHKGVIPDTIRTDVLAR